MDCHGDGSPDNFYCHENRPHDTPNQNLHTTEQILFIQQCVKRGGQSLRLAAPLSALKDHIFCTYLARIQPLLPPQDTLIQGAPLTKTISPV